MRSNIEIRIKDTGYGKDETLLTNCIKDYRYTIFEEDSHGY